MNIPPPADNGSKRTRRPAGRSRRGAPIPFRALIAYADVPAARRAMNEMGDVLASTRRHHELHPMLWRFDQLGASKWSEVALSDAATADVIVCASSESTSLPPALERWLAAVISRRQGVTTTIIAVLGSSEAWTISIEKPAVPAAAKAAGSAATLPTTTEQSSAFAA